MIPTAIAKQFLLIGVFGLVMNSSGFLMSAVLLTIPQALMIHFSYPIITIVGSALFTKEKPTILQVMASFLIIFGLKDAPRQGQSRTKGSGCQAPADHGERPVLESRRPSTDNLGAH